MFYDTNERDMLRVREHIVPDVSLYKLTSYWNEIHSRDLIVNSRLRRTKVGGAETDIFKRYQIFLTQLTG